MFNQKKTRPSLGNYERVSVAVIDGKKYINCLGLAQMTAPQLIKSLVSCALTVMLGFALVWAAYIAHTVVM